MEPLHSCGKQLCKFIGTEESIYIGKAFQSYRTDWFTNMVTILMFWLTNSSFMLMIHLSIWQASQSVKFKLS